MAAADVGDEPAGLELGDHAVERGQPLGHQARLVAHGEPAVRAVPQAVVVLVPADALAADEALGEPLAHRHGGVGRLEDGGHGELGRVVGEHERVLGRQPVGVRLRVVLHERARGLHVEPLAHVALERPGAGGELRRRHGLAVGHRLVEAELVAEGHERRVERGAQLGGDVADEGLELLLVDVGDRHQGASQRS